MIRKLLTPLCFVLSFGLLSQLNSTLVGQLDYEDTVNDIWGYVAPDGTEYALVGLNNGLSIVSLADPADPTEVAYVPGDESPWRDMKTLGTFAYLVADVGDDGLVAIDMSTLPDSVSYVSNIYDVPGFEREFVRAHNLYVDTVRQLIYTAGGDRNLNDGGVLVFDPKVNPLRPELAAVGPEIYAHDVYVQDGVVYASEIYDGHVSLYDNSQVDRFNFLGQSLTPFQFTHNAWADNDATHVFTTDERANAPVSSFDITDAGDIRLLDEYRPTPTLSTGTIPHNVHVIGDYLSISYYTDGLRVVDASVADNLVEVANYDTYAGFDGGFFGAWGAYPFLPSGLTLVSDRQTGLYVVDVNYKAAARMRGLVTDAADATAINDAQLRFLDSEFAKLERSDALGRYATGNADGGTFRVEVKALFYRTDTFTVSLTNGSTLARDFELERLPVYSYSARVVDDVNSEPIENAVVRLIHPDFSLIRSTDTDGRRAFDTVPAYVYDLDATAWGYVPFQLAEVDSSDIIGRTIRLDRGYQDDFLTDLGWQVYGVDRGRWERGVPARKQFEDRLLQPGFDAPGDLGDEAYFTELRGGGPGSGDVDNGRALLRSPPIDLSIYASPRLSYHYWFASAGGNLPSEDSLEVFLGDGRDSVRLAAYGGFVSAWQTDTFVLDSLAFIDSFEGPLYLTVIASDLRPNSNVVEAGFDNFRIENTDGTTSVDASPTDIPAVLTAYPNPSAFAFELAWDLAAMPRVGSNHELVVLSIDGRTVEVLPLGGRNGKLRLGENWTPGTYIALLRSGGRLSAEPLRLIKTAY